MPRLCMTSVMHNLPSKLAGTIFLEVMRRVYYEAAFPITLWYRAKPTGGYAKMHDQKRSMSVMVIYQQSADSTRVVKRYRTRQEFVDSRCTRTGDAKKTPASR